MRLRAQITDVRLNRATGEVWMLVSMTDKDHNVVEDVCLSPAWRDQDFTVSGVRSPAWLCIDDAIRAFVESDPSRGMTPIKRTRYEEAQESLPFTDESIHFTHGDE